ncbi:MAG: trypsin-like serine protease [Shimia sp.]|nr:trypsin-like serine protease [Shimia sp.]
MCSLLLWAFFAGAASADERLQPLKSRADLLGWEAIGRLDVAEQGYCTAVLISRDLVLTAAHCLFDRSGDAVPPEQVTFRAGYVAGDELAKRRIDKVVIDANYRDSPDGQISGIMLRHDVALLRLDRPILSDEADPFAVHVDPRNGEKVSVLSYGRGRSEHLSWQKDCSVLQQGGGVLVFDCDVTFGSSGAPVLVRYGTRARILSLVSAVSEGSDGQKESFGMELPHAVAALKRRMRAADAPVLRSSSGAKRIQTGNRSSSGAKFVRPGGG